LEGCESAAAALETKKDPVVADRAVEVWERMPERQVLYDSSPVISQVQKGYRVLIFLQQLHILLIMRGLRRF